jgi:hypothetical protein
MNIKIEGNTSTGFELEVESNGSKREYLVRQDGGEWTISEPQEAFSRRHLCRGNTLDWNVVGKAVQHGILAMQNDLLRIRQAEKLERARVSHQTK